MKNSGKEIQSKKFHFKRDGQMKARLFIAGAFKVNQRVVDCVPFNDREFLLIYREGDE